MPDGKRELERVRLAMVVRGHTNNDSTRRGEGR